MKVAGIDVGAKNAHIVIMDDEIILSKGEAPTGLGKAEAVERLYEELLTQAGLKRKDVERVVATGSAGKQVTFAQSFIPDAAANVKGVVKLIPSARTIIDVGAEEGRAMRVSLEGKILDFTTNERCAAGVGIFLETVAQALEISIEEMAQISLNSTRLIPLNAQCAVFAESEVVSLIHARTPKQDIAQAVHDIVARRVGSMARIIGLEDDIVMVGGVAKNVGFLQSLKRDLGRDVKVPKDPHLVGAFGAALAAAGQ